jgi:pimeloyl-ACP methyl ester carboxylesterase
MKTQNNSNLSRIAKYIVVIFFVGSIFYSCKKDKVEKPNEYLVESSLIATYNQSYMQYIISMIPEIGDALQGKQLLDVKVYKITYKTNNVDGSEIIASGVVIVPVSESPLPILSYQHGTIFDYAEAPSEFKTSLEISTLAVVMASAGYNLSIADYIGYGASANVPHPYEHNKTLGKTCYDMLMAAKEFLEDIKTVTSDKLFLTGYSEGGYATMALHKYIEENSELVVTMSAPAAGAYDKTGFAINVMDRNENLTFLPRFMWVLDAYNWIYGLNRPWNQYVNEPYATTLEAVDHPFHYGLAQISTNPQELFTSSIIDGILSRTDSQLLSALADNDIYDWKPKAPVTLYYGTADDYVFSLNSENAYYAMHARGANVTSVPYNGLNHTTALKPYLADMFKLFESLK